MAKTLLIHAGQHKTGSTAIQSYITNNSQFLKSHGIGLFQGVSKDHNAYELANLVIRDELMTPMRIIGTMPVPTVEQRKMGILSFCQILHNEPCERLLISAEAFSFIRLPEEFELVRSLADGSNLRALMFLRDIDSFQESWKTQITPLKAFPLFNTGKGIDEINSNSWLTDHIAIRKTWKGHCNFQDYNRCMSQEGTVIPTFLRWLDIDPDLSPEWHNYKLNITSKT